MTLTWLSKPVLVSCNSEKSTPRRISSKFQYKIKEGGVPHSVLTSHPAAPGSILRDLLTALLRTVDRGLIMSIEPI